MFCINIYASVTNAVLNTFLYKEVMLISLSNLLTDEIGVKVGNSNGPY
jgi:hypothetical protein